MTKNELNIISKYLNNLIGNLEQSIIDMQEDELDWCPQSEIEKRQKELDKIRDFLDKELTFVNKKLWE